MLYINTYKRFHLVAATSLMYYKQYNTLTYGFFSIIFTVGS